MQASRFPAFKQLRERSGGYLPFMTAEELRVSAHQPDSTIEERVGRSVVSGRVTVVAVHQ